MILGEIFEEISRNSYELIIMEDEDRNVLLMNILKGFLIFNEFIGNTLILKEKLSLPKKVEAIDFDWISAALIDVMLKQLPADANEEYRLNFDHNVSEAIAILPKFQTGIDVNPRLTDIREFEYTSDMILFDLLGLSVVHGWLVDPINEKGIYEVIQQFTYNQLVEKIVQAQLRRQSVSEEGLLQYQQGMLVENFLSENASQLTKYGLEELRRGIKQEELCILFRNNHFSTLHRHEGILYTLVTDQGFRDEAIYWEELVNVEGGGAFCDWQFKIYTPGDVTPFPETTTSQRDTVSSFDPNICFQRSESELDRE